MAGAIVSLKIWFAVLVLSTLVLTSLTAATVDWSSYTPAHSLGSGDDDWWINYPDQNPSAGSAVSHPQWVLGDLKSKPLLVLVRDTNCAACKVQKPQIDNLMKEYSSDINFIDMVTENDVRKASSFLDVYNPLGGPNYVPTTVFITLIKGPDGKVSVAWHSAVDVMDKGALRSYTEDAIYYWRENSQSWNP